MTDNCETGDPRQAKTLDEAAKNPDGTYNGSRALSWLSEVMNPDKGIPAEEIRNMMAEAVKKKKATQKGPTQCHTP